MWRSAIISLTVIASTQQVITSLVSSSNGDKWMLSVLYASAHPSILNDLWENLLQLQGLKPLPWIVMGDTNEVVSSDEKSGGNALGSSRRSGLIDFLRQEELNYLGYSGPRFNWFNTRNGQVYISESILIKPTVM